MTTLREAAEALMEAMLDGANRARAKDQRLLDALTKGTSKKASPEGPATSQDTTDKGSQ